MATRHRLAVVMDPIEDIKFAKDSTLAMLLAAQARGYELTYLTLADLHLRDGVALGRGRALQVHADANHWFDLAEPVVEPLGQFDVILMRKDPPFDVEFIYATYILERAELAGALVVNRPAGLRDMNEKVYTAWVPVFETLTDYGSRFAIVQRYLPEIVTTGDARVLVIDGEPVPYALARMPSGSDHRGNLAAGGKGVGRPLNERDRELVGRIGPVLAERGMLFVGLDVIGGYVTEINVTSPTGIRELDQQFGLCIADTLLDAIARRLASPRH